MQDFNHGPFAFEASGRIIKLGSIDSRKWAMLYDGRELAVHTLPNASGQTEIVEAFADDRAAFERSRRAKPDCLSLIEESTGRTLGSFNAARWPDGMTPGVINDDAPLWLRTVDRLRSMPVTLNQYAGIVASSAAPANAWITALLPDDVLTTDPAAWRAPSSWELRHLVGEGGFIGISGANAAALVGVNPQSFRKYTAQDGAASRQNMSYAMWHLLLHRLGVQRMQSHAN